MILDWCCRMYVDEPIITPEQYKTFFAIDEYGIHFDVANKIFRRNRKDGDYTEIVPASELNARAVNEIVQDILRTRATEGCINREGEFLHWKWEPEFTDHELGEDVKIESVSNAMLKDVLYQMLEDGYHWGTVYP